MADRDLDARIRDLRRRMEREPGSRSFVPLADEYRKAGRLSDAISALEEGLGAHPGYVAARIALARAYLEAGRIEESMAAFSKALSDDPSNLVAAKALGDLHLSRGESVEALKRYRRYRGISGDRRLDALIARLEEEVAPAQPSPGAAPPPPPPPSFRPTPVGLEGAAPPRLLTEPLAPALPGVAPPRSTDPHDISPIAYKRPSTGSIPVDSQPLGVPSRDQSLDALASSRGKDEEIITRKIRLPEATWPFETAGAPAGEPAPSPPEKTDAGPPRRTGADEPPRVEASEAEPTGRTLADLYFEQGHYGEALRVYEELLAANPSDHEITRLRDAAARLSAGPPPAERTAADPARQRRLAKIRLLNEWLDVIRTTGGDRKPGMGAGKTPGSAGS